jgi:hypothetical protein
LLIVKSSRSYPHAVKSYPQVIHIVIHIRFYFKQKWITLNKTAKSLARARYISRDVCANNSYNNNKSVVTKVIARARAKRFLKSFALALLLNKKNNKNVLQLEKNRIKLNVMKGGD